MSEMDNFREIIRELIKKELDEATTTGNIAGYETPMAFTGKGKGKKKGGKQRKGLNSNGWSRRVCTNCYKIVTTNTRCSKKGREFVRKKK